MGMYTQLVLNVEIYPDFVSEVERYIESVPRLRCVSHYFNGDHGYNEIRRHDSARCLRNPFVEPKSENTELMAWLHVNISCKNYEREIENFLDFLRGKIVRSGQEIEHVGHIRYEEWEMPKLIFATFHRKKDGRLQVLEIEKARSTPSTTSNRGSATTNRESQKTGDSTYSAAESSHSIVRDAINTSISASNTCTDM